MRLCFFVLYFVSRILAMWGIVERGLCDESRGEEGNCFYPSVVLYVVCIVYRIST